MLVLALAILPLLIIPLAVDLSTATERTFLALDWFIWAAFAVEYAIRLFLSPAKGKFIRRNLVDLIVVVIPFLRPLRVLRSARALRALRAARAFAFVLRGASAARVVLTRHKLNYVLLVVTVVAVVGALLVYQFERTAPDANISSIPDALWWAVTTVTTVGYGDRFPTTAAGRGIAVVLMILGISLFGVLAASLASYFVEQRGEVEVNPKLDRIAERLDHIEEQLRAGKKTTRRRRSPSS